MSASFKGKMAQEISDWENTGLINAEQAGLLHQRYDPAPFRGAIFLKWLGLFAIFMLGLSFLGFIGTILASVSPLFSTLCLMAVSYLVMHFGAKMASDKEQKHPFTGQALLTAGLIGFYASLSSIYLVSGGEKYSNVYGWFMLITSIAAFFTAYHFRLRWPLLIALLMFFHGAGSMPEYWGHGAYFLSVQDPRTMSVIALLTIIQGYTLISPENSESYWAPPSHDYREIGGRATPGAVAEVPLHSGSYSGLKNRGRKNRLKHKLTLSSSCTKILPRIPDQVRDKL